MAAASPAGAVLQTVLWNDAPRIPLEIPADARLPAGETYDTARSS